MSSAMRQKRLLLAGFAVVLVAAIAATAVVVQRRRAEEAAREKAQAEQAKAAVAAGTDIVLSGMIGARDVTSIPAPIDGKVKVFHADVGDIVYEGQLLAEIENLGLAASNEHSNLEVEKAQ